MKKLLCLMFAILLSVALLPSAIAERDGDFSDHTRDDQSYIDDEEEGKCDHDGNGCDVNADEMLISEDALDEMLTDLESIESEGNDSGDQMDGDSKALKYSYDPDLAIAQAPALLDAAVYNGGKCASYVSSVLRAGGLTSVNQSGAGDLIDYLNLNASSHFGGSIGKVIVNPTGNQLHKGDVLCVVCYKGGNSTNYTNGHSKGSGKYYGVHVVIVSSVVSNSQVKYYAANNTHYNSTLTLSSYASYCKCDKCKNNQYTKLIAFCFNDNIKSHASCDLNAYGNYSGKNYLYGSDFKSIDPYYWCSRNTSVSNISIDSSNRHNGYNSLKIVNSSAGADGKDLQIRAMVKPNVKQDHYAGDKGENQQMILSFWAKSSKAGTKIYFRWGYEKTSAYRSVSLTTDWAKYTVRMDKKSYFNRGIFPYINAAGTVWISEMQLEDGTTATDFVPENSGLYATTSSVYGGKYTMPENPTRLGYTFDGWYTTPSGGTKITDSTAVKAGHINVYAHWKKVVVEWNSEDVKYKGTTPYVIANGSAQTPRFTVINKEDNSVIDPANYDFEYKENTAAGTGYVIVTFKGDYEGTCRGSFKIYLPATTATKVANFKNGIKVTWEPVEGAAGYVIYRRAWSSTTNGWTAFARWDNTTETSYLDGHDASHKVYAGTRYQYGVKAYFARRTDPITGAEIGGNVNNDSGNFNLGLVGPLKTMVRITTRTLTSVTAGTKQMTVKWETNADFTGYQIQYATNKSFTQNVKTVKITDPKTAQKVIKKLTSGTTYYVRIRSYHEFEGTNYCGGWSSTLSCTVK